MHAHHFIIVLIYMLYRILNAVTSPASTSGTEQCCPKHAFRLYTHTHIYIYIFVSGYTTIKLTGCAWEGCDWRWMKAIQFHSKYPKINAVNDRMRLYKVSISCVYTQECPYIPKKCSCDAMHPIVVECYGMQHVSS